MGSEIDQWDTSPVPPPHDHTDPRAWCAVAVARLSRGQQESALDAARQAVDRDPYGEWGHRLASLALERLGRDAEAVEAAREAVRLVPGSWAARLRLGGALRRGSGQWRQAWAQARTAVRFAPEEADPHVLTGDLALLRGEHDRAARAYEAALSRSRDHRVARINLGLTLLRWERPRGHHDPAWEADPRDTGRARHAIVMWSRQIRVLLALALTAASVAGLGFDLRREAQIGGAAVLAAVLAITIRQAGRVRAWPYVVPMMRRDLWLSMSVSVGLLVVAAYVAGVATLPDTTLSDPTLPGTTAGALTRPEDGVWAGAFGLVLFNGLAVALARLIVETWRGRLVPALRQFAAAGDDRTALRDIDVTLWLVVGRAWWLVAIAALLPPVTGEPFAAVAALAVPVALLYGRARVARAGSGGLPLRVILRGDRWLAIALVALLVASAGLVVAGVAGGTAAILAGPETEGVPAGAGTSAVTRAALLGAAGALAVVAVAFAARAARAWWRGGPGPLRSSLVMSDARSAPMPGDVSPSTSLSDDVRHAATFSRSVVLAYTEPGGPRALAVSAVTSVSASGEFRLITGDEAWDAVERDPRVVLYVGDPRFWAEVRGVAVPDDDVLRVTPRHVLMREYPGRHQARTR
ncbi:hypothetical protein GCM10023194_20170 [Planotetraspora phitsanulokensis]|uniref:Bacterial transcriptional activator domain-containing protein n=1 Tax=Planotetraspora phitsanulokensis TaxID=575192 RepID=A0A8J3XF83_9ACTN|nr:BTAD domain-containing putative transcriptional regulator [Planotetraspora phitsanulokensis]GII39352.1 hypothetical protein Pph01_43550 [Planotetraspora phitsanulokensis]